VHAVLPTPVPRGRVRKCGAGERARGESGQPAQLIGAELAQPAEVGDAEVLADADERDPGRRHPQRPQPGEDLDELQLIVEVSLKPEDVVVVAVVLERAVAPRELRLAPDVGRALPL
jgi:hypothetical protein